MHDKEYFLLRYVYDLSIYSNAQLVKFIYDLKKDIFLWKQLPVYLLFRYLKYYFLNSQLAINYYKDKLFCIEYYELRWGLLVQIILKNFCNLIFLK